MILKYDPIFINEKFDVDMHIKCFAKLLSELKGYTEDWFFFKLVESQNLKTEKVKFTSTIHLSFYYFCLIIKSFS